MDFKCHCDSREIGRKAGPPYALGDFVLAQQSSLEYEVKRPTLAKNARMGHPKIQMQILKQIGIGRAKGLPARRHSNRQCRSKGNDGRERLADSPETQCL